ncbi:MAG: flagellar motor switch protein FliN [Acidimicrobiia bacterium]
MSVIEINDTRFAVGAATALAEALESTVELGLGPPAGAESLGMLTPTDAAATFGLRLQGDEPTVVALVLSQRLAETLAEKGEAFFTSTVIAALTRAATELGATALHDTPISLELDDVIGDPQGRLTAVALLEGTDRLATIAVRVGDDARPEAQADEAEPPVAAHSFDVFEGQSSAAHAASRALDLIHEVEMNVTVELGRTRLTVRELLGLTAGAVVELDRAAGSPVDVLVNGTPIARGEVVVVDEEFGIRITEIVGGVDPTRGHA